MRKWITIFFILIAGLKAKGQDYTDEIKIMTDSAISINYTELKNYYNKHAQGQDHFDNLFIINEYDEPLDQLLTPSKLNLKRLDLTDKKSRKIIGKGVRAWKVITSLKNSKFSVVILDLYITYKNEGYFLSNGGGLEVIFEYNCTENKWLFLSAKRGSV